MDKFDIIRLRELPTDRMAELVAEAERDGHRFPRRLVEEWQSGANRFAGPGEVLFAAVVNEQIVGVCGLNVDPYDGAPRVGRVRRLYVRAAYRSRGIGRRLVHQVIAAARGVFTVLRLRTEDREAAAFYEALGFRPCVGEPDCTHTLPLAEPGFTTGECCDSQPKMEAHR
jgi:GNAT superfamily N-acetyltransferase